MSRPHYDATSETRRLVDHLAGEEHRIPREALTIPTTAAVPGWRIIKGPGRDFSVVRPGHDEVVLTRDELVQVLRLEWAPAATATLDGARATTAAPTFIPVVTIADHIVVLAESAEAARVVGDTRLANAIDWALHRINSMTARTITAERSLKEARP